MPDGRLVWITREQRNWLPHLQQACPSILAACKAWDAAPADPIEAAAIAAHGENFGPSAREEAEAVCRAIRGLPSSDETTG